MHVIVSRACRIGDFARQPSSIRRRASNGSVEDGSGDDRPHQHENHAETLDHPHKRTLASRPETVEGHIDRIADFAVAQSMKQHCSPETLAAFARVIRGR
jgi:hypothetical protein